MSDTHKLVKLCLDHVPEELKTGAYHVNWEPGTKIPKIAGTLRNASSRDPETWRTLQECIASMERHPGRYAGLGRVIVKGDPYVGVDLDHVRDAKTGELTPRAAEIVRRLASYTEVSPSQTGVKLWIRAELSRTYKKPGVEIYPHGRYFTLTGWILPQALPTAEERQAELEALIVEEFPSFAAEQKPQRPYRGKPGERIDLSAFLEARGVEVLGEAADGTAERVYRVMCPWVHEHSGGDRSGTRVGQYPDGALFFRCEHAHCAHRGWAEFRDHLSPPTVFLRRRSKARRVRSVAR